MHYFVSIILLLLLLLWLPFPLLHVMTDMKVLDSASPDLIADPDQFLFQLWPFGQSLNWSSPLISAGGNTDNNNEQQSRLSAHTCPPDKQSKFQQLRPSWACDPVVKPEPKMITSVIIIVLRSARCRVRCDLSQFLHRLDDVGQQLVCSRVWLRPTTGRGRDICEQCRRVVSEHDCLQSDPGPPNA